MQRRILIAEDNIEISDTMRNYLIRAGYTVYQAFDGGDALEQARKLSPDLIAGYYDARCRRLRGMRKHKTRYERAHYRRQRKGCGGR